MKLALFVLLSVSVVVARGDIAPTSFIASGVHLEQSSSVRMQRADVDIAWGTPCTLSATFTMINESAAAEDLEVGFPMPTPDEDRFGRPNAAADPLSISFNGQPVDVTASGASDTDRDQRRGWRWFRCRHLFAPGETTVEVRTILRASLVYCGPFRESLFYCIESGGHWAGPIGEETVTVSFPGPIAADQIASATPAGYRIDGSRLCWQLRNFEPAGKEYDIAVTYVRPDVMRTIAELRAEHAADPASASRAVKLARHLLALGYAKSNSGFPPWRLSPDEYQSIKQGIKRRGDRDTFVRHYRLQDDGSYREVSSEWTRERSALVRILAEAGYRDARSRDPFILEGEAPLNGVLRREPANAAAWNVFLASYWRFSFAAMGHWFGGTVLSRKQADLIRTAARNCPADPWIQHWLAMVKSGGHRDDHEAVMEALFSQDFMKLEFPAVQYDYY